MRSIHFGYFVVATLVLTSFIPLSLGLSCSGIFYPTLSESLGVEKGALSYYVSFIWLASLVSLPLTGRLLSKFDARICLSAAVIVIAVAFVWLANMQALWQFYAGAFAIGVSVGMLLFLAPSTLINRWFAVRAGFLLGIVMAFTGVGGVVWATAGGAMIAALGWRATYLVFAVLTIVTLPATIFMMADSPEDKNLTPYGADQANAATVKAKGVSASAAFKMPVFYVLCIMCALLNVGMYVYFMIPSYATTLAVGIAFPLLGATASSVAMAGQTISKLTLGAVGERFPQRATITTLIFGIIGILALRFLAESIPVFYVATLLYGAYYGITNVMMPIFTRRCFGDADYARIYARVSMVASITNASAAFIWGTLIDATGGYDVMFYGVAALMAITIVTVIAVGRMQTVKGNEDELV